MIAWLLFWTAYGPVAAPTGGPGLIIGDLTWVARHGGDLTHKTRHDGDLTYRSED